MDPGDAGRRLTPLRPLVYKRSRRFAYGAGATLAGALTFALGLGDAWSLLGSGAGALIVAGTLRLVGRTFAMQARVLEELEFRRIVLGIGTLAAVFGTVVFVLAIARWQFDVVSNRVLWINSAGSSATSHLSSGRNCGTSRSTSEAPSRPSSSRGSTGCSRRAGSRRRRTTDARRMCEPEHRGRSYDSSHGIRTRVLDDKLTAKFQS